MDYFSAFLEEKGQPEKPYFRGHSVHSPHTYFAIS